jgi:anti-sigma regulatory factor (Ser/Thr protein kinase)
MIGLLSGRPRTGRLFAHSHFTMSLRHGPRAPSEARRRVAARLEDAVDHGVLETVTLLISETVTNCVEHAPVGGDIDVRVSLLPAVMRAEVSTSGPAFRAARPDAARVTDEHGRGLQIVGVLAERWGIRPESNSVWFEIALNGTT